jgi:hypothetical protein
VEFVLVPLLFLLPFALTALPSVAAANLIPPSWPRLRYGMAIALFALFVTPSWGSATIVSVPLPFGGLLLLTAVTASPGELLESIQERPLWHAVAFPVTAIIGALIFRKLRPNNSFKPKPLRGSA